MNTQKQAFTLVELIVVITILAILSTIAFISLQWYSEDARDSTRISDINNIKISLELFSLATWKYPLPDNSQDVTYSWSTLWNQWTIWNQVITNLSRNLSKIPTDPLYGTEYVYSTLENKKEYELMSLYEWSNVSSNGLLNTTYAATNTTVRMDGTYNWLFIKTANYIIPTPSIITADTLPWVLDSELIQSQVTNGGTNIPNMWIAKISVSTGALSNLSLSVYNGSINEDSSAVEKLAVYQALEWAYSGSSLANKWIYKTLLAQTTDDEKVTFTHSVVVNDSSEHNLITGTCDNATKPTDNGNIAYIENPTWENQAYVQDGGECWYTCTGWYTWVSCDIIPALITSANCTYANWIWISSWYDVNIWTSQWDWFCISPRMWTFWEWATDGMPWNGWWNDLVNGSFWGWDSNAVDDTSNTSVAKYGQTKLLDTDSWYTCVILWSASSDYDLTDAQGDTIYNRMKWLATNQSNLTELQNIDWIQNATPPNGHSVSALFLSDCIDGVKDLWTTMSYIHNDGNSEEITYAEYNTDVSSTTSGWDLSNTTYQNRQKYLTAWTQEVGSHLPSAFSYIISWNASANDTVWDFLTWTDRWEYQMACDNWLLTDLEGNPDQKWIWLSAIGWMSGNYWGAGARIIWETACDNQHHSSTGGRDGSKAARFIVRP